MKCNLKPGLVLALAVNLGWAVAASAEPISGKEARGLLFAAKGAEAEILTEAGLPEDQAKILATVAADQPYYGAIAYSPEDGLASEGTVAAANFHDTASASAAALAGCNAAKKGKADCVVAVLIRPKGWEERGFQLSQDATAAFEKDYDAKTGALAVSAATGAFSVARGAGAGESAVGACAANPAAPADCALAVAE